MNLEFFLLQDVKLVMLTTSLHLLCSDMALQDVLQTKHTLHGSEKSLHTDAYGWWTGELTQKQSSVSL